MQPSIEIIKQAVTNSFLVREFKVKAFEAPFHFHPEFELTLILSGSGSRMVGNHIDNYTAGDLVLVGSNVPHCWKTNTTDKFAVKSHSIVIHFMVDCFGDTFFDRPELKSIKRLLDKSIAGVRFTHIPVPVREKIKIILKVSDPFKKMILFFEILGVLADTRKIQFLDTQGMMATYSNADMQRLNKVYDYIAINFKELILLKDVAATINMTPNAFCKYFKKVSRRTLIETVLQYRINHTIIQLLQTNKAVADICYDSGFGNLSYFNKVFKSRMRFSPLQYRKKFAEDK